MLPNPLHPAVVHFPVVLAFLLPLFIGGGLWQIRRGASVRRSWLLPTAVAAALAASAWLSVQTGDAQAERVERVVGEAPLETHEDLADAFLATSVAMTLVAAAGLVGGITGRAARMITAVGSLALVGLVARLGHTGGQLVYRHGAASAYTETRGRTPDSTASAAAPNERRNQRDTDHDAR